METRHGPTIHLRCVINPSPANAISRAAIGPITRQRRENTNPSDPGHTRGDNAPYGRCNADSPSSVRPTPPRPSNKRRASDGGWVGRRRGVGRPSGLAIQIGWPSLRGIPHSDNHLQQSVAAHTNLARQQARPWMFARPPSDEACNRPGPTTKSGHLAAKATRCPARSRLTPIGGTANRP